MTEKQIKSIHKKVAKVDEAKWLFSMWTPPSRQVGKVLRMQQSNMLKHLCWTSAPPQGFAQGVTVRVHGSFFDAVYVFLI